MKQLQWFSWIFPRLTQNFRLICSTFNIRIEEKTGKIRKFSQNGHKKRRMLLSQIDEIWFRTQRHCCIIKSSAFAIKLVRAAWSPVIFQTHLVNMNESVIRNMPEFFSFFSLTIASFQQLHSWLNNHYLPLYRYWLCYNTEPFLLTFTLYAFPKTPIERALPNFFSIYDLSLTLLVSYSSTHFFPSFFSICYTVSDFHLKMLWTNEFTKLSDAAQCFLLDLHCPKTHTLTKKL